VHEIPFEDYIIQQNVPAHFMEHKQAHGSQDRILTFADILDEDPATGETNYLTIDGEQVSVAEAKKNYFKAIADNIEESKLHLEEDYARLTEIGIDKIIREMYLPWLKAEEFKDRDDEKILEGLKIDDITYEYISATGEGRFDIFFISCSMETYDMLESDCMELTLKDGDIKFDAWVV
jgi:hypothetical protein